MVALEFKIQIYGTRQKSTIEFWELYQNSINVNFLHPLLGCIYAHIAHTMACGTFIAPLSQTIYDK
jgi:hypothetical protein